MFRLRSFTLAVVCLGLLCTTPAVAAWEFGLSSATTLSYIYFSQMGDNGFFGKYNVSTTAEEAVANGWLGEAVGLVSGADASISSSSTSFFPWFSANQIIFLSGVYRVGNVDTATYPGGGVAHADGEWLGWLITFETPWGIASYGKKPFGFGMGLQYDSTARTEEQLALVADYGPFQFGLGFYPSRVPVELNPNRDFYDQPFSSYWNQNDKSAKTQKDLFAFLQYASGPVELSVGCLYNRQHMGPEGTARFDQRRHIAPMDLESNEGWVYGRYDNGRFFVHAEADWCYQTARFRRSVSGRRIWPPLEALAAEPENTDGSGSIFRPLYTEAWRYAVEGGVRMGPWRLSCLYAYVPGPDRRHGVLIDRQPVIVNPFLPNLDYVIHHPDHGNATLFRNYSQILVNNYGTGLNALNRGNEGYLVDASAMAARVDYALAANLNVYASALVARRVSHGYGWGYILPLHASPTSDFLDVYYWPDRDYEDPSPAIPEDDLGWEVDAGMDWKLLETVILNLTASYWQPGKWFNFACVDTSVAGWDSSARTPPEDRTFPWGANPDRKIDGIFGLNCAIAVVF